MQREPMRQGEMAVVKGLRQCKDLDELLIIEISAEYSARKISGCKMLGILLEI